MEQEVNKTQETENELKKVSVTRTGDVAGWRHETESMSLKEQKHLKDYLKDKCHDVRADTKTGVTKWMFYGYKELTQVLDAEAKMVNCVKGVEFDFSFAQKETE